MVEPAPSVDEVFLSEHARERYIQVAPSIEWIGSEDHFDSNNNDFYILRDGSEGGMGSGSGSGKRDRRLLSLDETLLAEEENDRIMQSETYDDYDLSTPTATSSSKLHRKRSGIGISFDKGVCGAKSIAEGEHEEGDEDETLITVDSNSRKAHHDRVGTDGGGRYGDRDRESSSNKDKRRGTLRETGLFANHDYHEDDDGTFGIADDDDDRSVLSHNERFETRIRIRNHEDARSNGQPINLIGGTNQDYLALARLYRIQRPYSDPNYQALCLLCHREYCEDVFFPCEHHCVCRKCIKREKICEESGLKKDPKGYCNCSLCAGIIKKILPLEGGKEIQRYWDWVYEEKIELPIGFMRNWRHSAAVIQKIYIDEKYQNYGTDGVSSFCSIS